MNIGVSLDTSDAVEQSTLGDVSNVSGLTSKSGKKKGKGKKIVKKKKPKKQSLAPLEEEEKRLEQVTSVE